MNNRLLSVLSAILDDRKKTPWAKSLGIGGGAISRFFLEGVYPADKHLSKIMKAENASMDALWGGSSAPFMVQRTNSVKETNDELKAHLDDEQLDIYIITSGEKQHDEFPIIVLSVLVIDNIGSEDELKYNSIQIICGPTDHETGNLFRDKTVRHQILPVDQIHQLATGYKGTYFLFGKDTLLNAEVIDQSDINRILCKESTNSAKLLNRVMEIVDETITEEGAEVTAKQRRKLVVELYVFAVKEGLLDEDVNPNLAQSMLRLI